MRVTASLTIVVALVLTTLPVTGGLATVSAFSIDEPTEPVTFTALPDTFDTTFTTSAFHVYGRYRAIIWMEGPERVELGVRTIPLPITGDDPAGPLTQTESITVPASTPSGTYTLCIRAEENWPPGSESWGFSMTDCVEDVIEIAGVIDSIEFTQAVQELQDLDELREDGPTIPLVEGRPAVMRVYPAAVDDAQRIRMEATGSVDGQRTRTVVPGCDPQDSREDRRCASFDFSFTAGDSVDVTVTAYDTEGAELDRQEFAFETASTTPIRIRPVSVCDDFEVVPGPSNLRRWDCGDAASIGAMVDFTRRTFPGEISMMSAGYRVRSFKDPAEDAFDWWVGVLDSLQIRWRWSIPPSPGDRFYHGAVRADAGTSGIGGVARRPGHVGATREIVMREGNDVADETLAHELGHNFGWRHAPQAGSGFDHTAVDGCYNTPGNQDPTWPHGDDPSINEIGFDVVRRVPVSAERFDWMSYCTPRWVSPYTFGNTLDRFHERGPTIQSADATTATPEAVWYVAGTIDDGEATLSPLFAIERPLEADPDEGSHRIEVRDDDGVVLAARRFQPQHQMLVDVPLPEAFAEFVPRIAGAATVAIVGPEDTQLTSVALAGQAPTVTITAPGAGQVIDEPTVLSWEIDDADSEAHTFVVEYSRDGGQTWDVLDAGLDEPHVTVEPSLLAGSTDPGASLVRVHASDGVNSGSATSPGFTVVGAPPTVAITAPENGHVVAGGDLVWLQGYAVDPEDGALDEEIVWTSDLDGVLGTGEQLAVTTLSAGQHLITLTATDRDGNTVSDELTVVVDDTPPEIDIQVGDGLPDGPGEILVLRTTSVSASIETSLLVHDLDFTSIHTDDFASVDLAAYDTIIVGMDGGSIGEADVRALAAAIDDGSRVVAFGGTTTQTFVDAVDRYLLGVDTTSFAWQTPGSPHWVLTDAAHSLARQLPDEHDFVTLAGQTRNPSEYLLRITDPDAEVVARNGDDVPALVSAQDGALIWLVNTPWGAIWGDPMDTLLLDQLLENALGLRLFVERPVEVTVDASDTGSGLDWVDYSVDGGVSWISVEPDALPTDFPLDEEGEVHLLVRAADRAGNLAAESVRFEIVAERDPPAGPIARDDCRYPGWVNFGFPNLGQCVRFVETGKEPPPGHQS